MGHKIAEAIIENGQITHVDKRLPAGRIKVHLIYDSEKELSSTQEVVRIIQETAGIYKGIDVEVESHKLRADWERRIEN